MKQGVCKLTKRHHTSKRQLFYPSNVLVPSPVRCLQLGGPHGPPTTNSQERVCRLIAPAPEPGPGTQATGGSATRGSESPREHGWAHAKIKCISIQETREKNELLAELGTLCKGSNPEKSRCVSSSAHWLNSRGTWLAASEQPWVWSRKTSSIRIAAV